MSMGMLLYQEKAQIQRINLQEKVNQRKVMIYYMQKNLLIKQMPKEIKNRGEDNISKEKERQPQKGEASKAVIKKHIKESVSKSDIPRKKDN